MEQIKIGTCIPGKLAEKWLPAMKNYDFECFAVNFHMTYGGIDIRELAPKVQEILAGTGKTVTTLGYYCNALENESQRRDLEYAIDNAHLFGAKTVSTFAGALEGKDVPAAMPRFKEVFSELARRAEDNGVKIAIENCPMDGDWRHATCNIGFNPDAWEMMFDAVPSEALGLEWEPAHQLRELIDPIQNLRKWAKKVVHVHGKDATVAWDVIREYGIRGIHPFAWDRTPGFGDTNWADIFTILLQNGFEGAVDIEGYHDPVHYDDMEWSAQVTGLEYLKRCRGGINFIPGPEEIRGFQGKRKK